MYTRNVWIVAPAYMLAFRIFEDSALKLRAVPEDEEGIDIDFLRREIRKSEEKAAAEGNTEPVSGVHVGHIQLGQTTTQGWVHDASQQRDLRRA